MAWGTWSDRDSNEMILFSNNAVDVPTWTNKHEDEEGTQAAPQLEMTKNPRLVPNSMT